MGRAEDIFKKIKNEGEDAIDEFILTRQSEELFLDFKRVTDNGIGRSLHQNDRINLAKAISGFGNSEGGVIVWGVDCSTDVMGADVPHTKCPISDTKRFVSWLEGAVSGCTVPPHTKIEHFAIETKNNNGFAISLIPKSDYAPHQVVLRGKSNYRYYLRAGSNFEHVPHAVLAGMFGRRPQPHVFHNFTIGPAELFKDSIIKVSLGLMVSNNGPGIASDLFMNAMVFSTIGENCDIVIHPIDSKDWSGQQSFGRHFSMISKRDYRLPPESFTQPFTIDFFIRPPFTKDLLIKCICGSGQSPSMKFNIENTGTQIEESYNKFTKMSSPTIDDCHSVAAKILNLDD